MYYNVNASDLDPQHLEPTTFVLQHLHCCCTGFGESPVKLRLANSLSRLTCSEGMAEEYQRMVVFNEGGVGI